MLRMVVVNCVTILYNVYPSAMMPCTRFAMKGYHLIIEMFPKTTNNQQLLPSAEANQYPQTSIPNIYVFLHSYSQIIKRRQASEGSVGNAGDDIKAQLPNGQG